MMMSTVPAIADATSATLETSKPPKDGPLTASGFRIANAMPAPPDASKTRPATKRAIAQPF